VSDQGNILGETDCAFRGFLRMTNWGFIPSKQLSSSSCLSRLVSSALCGLSFLNDVSLGLYTRVAKGKTRKAAQKSITSRVFSSSKVFFFHGRKNLSSFFSMPHPLFLHFPLSLRAICCCLVVQTHSFLHRKLNRSFLISRSGQDDRSFLHQEKTKRSFLLC
jgi:hypothetical protein